MSGNAINAALREAEKNGQNLYWIRPDGAIRILGARQYKNYSLVNTASGWQDADKVYEIEAR